MLSIGWIEMLMIGSIALIVVGPKDLPKMLQQLGKMVGSVRRMGNEFRTEINKATALDGVTDIRKSITQPFQTAREEIEREFNATNKDGMTVPSGALKPNDPNAESVVNEIQAAIGKTPVGENSMIDPKRALQDAAKREAVEYKAKAEMAAANAEALKPVANASTAKGVAKKTPPRRKSATTATAKPAVVKAAPVKAASAKKPAAKKPAQRKKPTAAKAEANK